MKLKKVIVFALLASLSLFLVTACSSDDDNDKGSSFSGLLDPEDAYQEGVSFHVIVADMGLIDEPYRYGSHMVMITAIDPDHFEADITVSVNNQEVEDVFGMYQTWGFEYDFVVGDTYLLEINAHNETFSRSIKIPYRMTNAEFPESYSPSQSAEVSWVLEGNNENQLIAVHADHPGDDEYDDWFRELSPTVRSYNIDAGVVEDFGTDAYYSIGIMQVNFSMTDEIVVLALTGEYQDYGDDWRLKAEDLPERFKHYIESKTK